MSTRNWQLRCAELKHRGAYLYKTKLWSDCAFQLDDVTIKAHKLIMAMASPEFSKILYGRGVINSPVPILDVRAEVFNIMLEYIYTDNLNINSPRDACDLYYAAKTWRVLYVVKECVKYLSENMTPDNVCHIYELACESRDVLLQKACEKVFSMKTKEILNDMSFYEAKLSTVARLFTFDPLNIDSEMDLFQAAVKYANVYDKKVEEDGLQGIVSNEGNECHCINCADGPSIPKKSRRVLEENASQELPRSRQISNNENLEDIIVQDKESTNKENENSNSASESMSSTGKNRAEATKLKYQDIIKQIRFLTLTPKDFAENSASLLSLLTQSQIFAICMNIASADTTISIPEGFCKSLVPRTLATVGQRFQQSTVFRSIIHGIRNIRKYESPPFYVRNLAWTFLYIQFFEPNEQDAVVAVNCFYEAGSLDWVKTAKIKVKFCTHKPVPKHLHKITLNNHNSESPEYILWVTRIKKSDILNPEYGFIDDFNSITYKIYVNTESRIAESPVSTLACSVPSNTSNNALKMSSGPPEMSVLTTQSSVVRQSVENALVHKSVTTSTRQQVMTTTVSSRHSNITNSIPLTCQAKVNMPPVNSSRQLSVTMPDNLSQHPSVTTRPSVMSSPIPQLKRPYLNTPISSSRHSIVSTSGALIRPSMMSTPIRHSQCSNLNTPVNSSRQSIMSTPEGFIRSSIISTPIPNSQCSNYNTSSLNSSNQSIVSTPGALTRSSMMSTPTPHSQCSNLNTSSVNSSRQSIVSTPGALIRPSMMSTPTPHSQSLNLNISSVNSSHQSIVSTPGALIRPLMMSTPILHSQCSNLNTSLNSSYQSIVSTPGALTSPSMMSTLTPSSQYPNSNTPINSARQSRVSRPGSFIRPSMLSIPLPSSQYPNLNTPPTTSSSPLNVTMPTGSLQRSPVTPPEALTLPSMTSTTQLLISNTSSINSVLNSSVTPVTLTQYSNFNTAVNSLRTTIISTSLPQSNNTITNTSVPSPGKLVVKTPPMNSPRSSLTTAPVRPSWHTPECRPKSSIHQTIRNRSPTGIISIKPSLNVQNSTRGSPSILPVPANILPATVSSSVSSRPSIHYDSDKTSLISSVVPSCPSTITLPNNPSQASPIITNTKSPSSFKTLVYRTSSVRLPPSTASSPVLSQGFPTLSVLSSSPMNKKTAISSPTWQTVNITRNNPSLPVTIASNAYSSVPMTLPPTVTTMTYPSPLITTAEMSSTTTYPFDDKDSSSVINSEIPSHPSPNIITSENVITSPILADLLSSSTVTKNSVTSSHNTSLHSKRPTSKEFLSVTTSQIQTSSLLSPQSNDLYVTSHLSPPVTTSALSYQPLHSRTVPWPTRRINADSIASSQTCTKTSKIKSIPGPIKAITADTSSSASAPLITTKYSSSSNTENAELKQVFRTSPLPPVTTAATSFQPLHSVTLPWPSTFTDSITNSREVISRETTKLINTTTAVETASLFAKTIVTSSDVVLTESSQQLSMTTSDTICTMSNLEIPEPSNNVLFQIDSPAMFDEDIETLTNDLKLEEPSVLDTAETVAQPPSLKDIAFSTLRTLIFKEESESIENSIEDLIETIKEVRPEAIYQPSSLKQIAISMLGSLILRDDYHVLLELSMDRKSNLEIDEEKSKSDLSNQLNPPSLKQIAYSMLGDIIVKEDL